MMMNDMNPDTVEQMMMNDMNPDMVDADDDGWA